MGVTFGILSSLRLPVFVQGTCTPQVHAHVGRTAQTRISPRDLSYGQWVVDILDGLGLECAPMVGPSYGAGIILRAAACAPKRISRAVLVVPSGIVNVPTWSTTRKILIPMMLYRCFPSPERLLRATRPLCTEEPDEACLEIMGAVYRHVRFTLLPRLATRDELVKFQAPTLVLAARQDVFFPAEAVLPRAKHIIPHVTAECIEGGPCSIA